MIKEACVETLKQAIEAERRGADRLELCADLEVDGLTPPMELVREVIETVRIPVMVMIRPRAGGFVYDRIEREIMKSQIERCRELGAAGVVVGLLDQDGRVDVKNTQRLAEWAAPLDVTFHKAIDVTPDLLTETLRVSEIPGVSRILTSGGKKKAWKGRDWINQMVKLSGSNATIVAAGRITNQNLEMLSRELHVQEFHGRRIVGNLGE